MLKTSETISVNLKRILLKFNFGKKSEFKRIILKQKSDFLYFIIVYGIIQRLKKIRQLFFWKKLYEKRIVKIRDLMKEN